MMKRSHTSIFTLVIAISALMLLMPAQATHAQGSSGKKIAATNKDTIPLLRNVAVSADLVGPIQLMVSDYGQYEAALRVNLKDKYFPVVEIGIGKADGTDESTQINYKTTARTNRLRLQPVAQQARHLSPVWRCKIRHHLFQIRPQGSGYPGPYMGRYDSLRGQRCEVQLPLG